MIVGVVSPKGGPGKTTTSVNLSASLALKGYSVALLDADEINKHSIQWGEIRDLNGAVKIDVHATPYNVLAKTAMAVNGEYEAVVIDGRPSTEAITTTIVQLSDMLVIPVAIGTFDMWSIRDFIDLYDSACKLSQKGFVPGCFVINRFEGVSHFVKDLMDILQEYGDRYPLKLIETRMRRRDDYSKVITYGISIPEANAEMIEVVEKDGKLFVPSDHIKEHLPIRLVTPSAIEEKIYEMKADGKFQEASRFKPVFPRIDTAKQEWESIFDEIMNIVLHPETEAK